MKFTTNIYVSFLVSNFERSLAFYDILMATLGVQRLKVIQAQGRREAEYGLDEYSKMLSILESPDYSSEAIQLFTSLTSFPAENQSAVDKFFIAAIANGATEVEKPGFREGGSYTASVEDLDGHHIGACFLNSN